MDLSFFFRYHYTKGADAAAAGTETAASLLTTLGGAARSEKTLRFQASLRAEWSQNNLPFIGDIRSYSNPGNRFFLFSLSFFFLYLLFTFPSFHRLPRSDSRLCLSSSNYFRSIRRPLTRTGKTMHRQHPAEEENVPARSSQLSRTFVDG